MRQRIMQASFHYYLGEVGGVSERPAEFIHSDEYREAANNWEEFTGSEEVLEISQSSVINCLRGTEALQVP
jgi:hypothetical protein